MLIVVSVLRVVSRSIQNRRLVRVQIQETRLLMLVESKRWCGMLLGVSNLA